MEEKPEIIQIERPWGNFRRFTHNTPSTVKIITIKPGEEISVQTHSHRAEFWHVISGSGVFDIDGKSYHVIKGSEYFVPVGMTHRIEAGSEGIEVMEISLGEFDESDIIHIEDKYGRV